MTLDTVHQHSLQQAASATSHCYISGQRGTPWLPTCTCLSYMCQAPPGNPAGGGAAYELSLSGRELRPHACMAPCLATCLQMSDTLLRQLALQCRASSRTLLQQGLLPGQVATLAKPHLDCTQTLLHAGPAGRRVARPLAAQSSAVLAALSRCFCCLQEGLSPREMAV